MCTQRQSLLFSHYYISLTLPSSLLLCLFVTGKPTLPRSATCCSYITDKFYYLQYKYVGTCDREDSLDADLSSLMSCECCSPSAPVDCA